MLKIVLSDSKRRWLRFLVANAVHHVFDKGLNLICCKSERVTFSNEADGLPRTVNNHLAGLAFVQMLLKASPDFRTGDFFQVVPEFCQKLSAAEHWDSFFPC